MRSAVMRTMAITIAALACLPSAAHAGLGEPLASVAVDGTRMGARVASATIGRYRRHELVRPNGGMVHEFTNANGAVFAVSWSGPGKPDLRSLLGRYFATFQATGASIGQTMHSLRRPPQVDQADLQIQTAGHMGWFRGIAFVPSLAPAGTAAADLPSP